jgi:hypothetical protein
MAYCCDNKCWWNVFGSIKKVLAPCIITGNDGTDYGYRYNAFGSTDKETVSDGTRFYEFTTNSSNLIVIRFGDTGITKLTDVNEILVEHESDSYLATWDGALKAYTFTDAAFSQFIIGSTDFCTAMYILPDLFIHYDFKTIETGEKI